MKTSRLVPLSSACCLILAACKKSEAPPAGAAAGQSAGELAAQRVQIEEERIELERERLAEERAALEEAKEALRAEREARLVAREMEAEWQDLSIEERQFQLAEREADLGAREEEFALREASLSERELELAGQDALDGWEPDLLPEMYEPVADYETFYEDLQPYGSWYETPDYGYVYQPTVVVQDNSWRPYTRGRWACTNLGWNWISDEPFGWACFHYGRWALLDGRGWVWVPGDEWAPAWVCWREGSEHVGWAPLPPETLCYRGRGWDSSVEAEFGIGPICFNFVPRRHMADPLWRHCLPVERNADCIGQTRNITNLRFHRDRIIAGGPGYERLRRDVGKPWPVYQIETDRYRAIRDLNQRNASVRGGRLAVFAPNLNTRWNDQLKPSRIAGRWDEVKVVRAESGIKPQWTERFREAREKRKEAAAAPVELADKVKQFEVNRQKTGAAQRVLEEKQRQLSEARREQQVLRRAVAREAGRPAAGDAVVRAADRTGPAAAKGKNETPVERAPTLAERQREAADRLRETRARRTGTAGITPAPGAGPESPPAGMTRRGGAPRPLEVTPTPGEPAREAVAGVREEADPRQATNRRGSSTPAGGEASGRVPRPESTGDGATAESARRAQTEALRRQQQEQADRNRGQSPPDTSRDSRAPQIEQVRREVPARPGLRPVPPSADDGSARGNAEAARQQQLQAARERLEQARQQQAERQGNDNAARLRQAEEARALQEQSRQQQQDEMRRQQQEQSRQQQQEEMRRQQQEQSRQQQQEEMRRQQQEQARQQQQEEMRRQQQEEMRRQQQEQARQQQEEMRRQQQEEARRQNEERARQQQEERARQQEQARQQQEERARQMEQARQQQEERARQQQEEQQRRQEERAREQSERQEQQRPRGR
jgi:hypothetical protein